MKIATITISPELIDKYEYEWCDNCPIIHASRNVLKDVFSCSLGSITLGNPDDGFTRVHYSFEVDVKIVDMQKGKIPIEEIVFDVYDNKELV